MTNARSPGGREWRLGPLALARESAAAVLVHSATVPSGGLLTFSAAGFRPGVELIIAVDYGSSVIGTFPLDASGSTGEFNRLGIPADVRPGRHVLTFTDGTDTFDLLVRVTASTVAVAIDPPSSRAGGRVRFVGRGFAPDVEIHVKFDESGEPLTFGTNSAGAISGVVPVPEHAAAGAHEVWFLARPAISLAVPVRVDP